MMKFSVAWSVTAYDVFRAANMYLMSFVRPVVEDIPLTYGNSNFIVRYVCIICIGPSIVQCDKN